MSMNRHRSHLYDLLRIKEPTLPCLTISDSLALTSKEEYKDALDETASQETLFHVQQSYFHQKKRALIMCLKDGMRQGKAAL